MTLKQTTWTTGKQEAAADDLSYAFMFIDETADVQFWSQRKVQWATRQRPFCRHIPPLAKVALESLE